MGYVPKRRHRHGSYAPILSSEGRTGLSLGAELRAGNVPAGTGAWSFVAAQLDKLPNTIAQARTRVRLDGAFYDKQVTQPLDERRIGYCLVAKMTQPLRDRMVAAR
ncbi:MAG: transposase [Candidatus Omnitrophica bacterium]|nr:transposase [Candidatus Omnitrophota bacterium]